MNTFTPDIIEILKKIRQDSFLMSLKHKEIYQNNKTTSQYFDLPTIVLSIFSSSLKQGVMIEIFFTIIPPSNFLFENQSSLSLYYFLHPFPNQESI